jgi:MFS family permease
LGSPKLSYGYRTALRGWAVAFCILAGPFVYFVKPRIPVSRASGPQKISFAFVGTRLFWVLQIDNIIEDLRFFIPSIYLPTYASSLGFPEIMGTISISLLNSTSVFGSLIIGFLVDRRHITTVMLVSSLGATLAVFLFWGLAASTPVLSIFAVMYGLFVGGFSASWTGVIKAIRLQNPESDSGTIFELLAAGRGIGAVVSGPLSVRIISSMGGSGIGGYGTGYRVAIIFTGITALFGGVSWMGRKAKMI